MKRAEYDPERAGALCSQCPLRGQSAVIPPEGPSDASIVVVGESPALQDVKQGRPFMGPNGTKLASILEAAQLKRSQVYLTNALLCRVETPGATGAKRFDIKAYLSFLNKLNTERRKMARAAKQPFTPFPSPFACCRPRLMRELAHFERVAQERHASFDDRPNGAVVMPLGNFAAQTILGSQGIMKLRGFPARMEFVNGELTKTPTEGANEETKEERGEAEGIDYGDPKYDE